MTDLHEVADNIFVVRQKAGMGGIKPPMNIYVLAGNNGLIFDAGYGTRRDIQHARNSVEAIQQRFEKQGKVCRIGRILPSHTHPDHFSGLKGMRKELGLSVLLTKKMAERITSVAIYRQSYAEPEGEQGVFSHRQSGLRKFMHWQLSRLYYNKIFGVTFLSNPDELIEEESTIDINGETWDILSGHGHCDDHVMLYRKETGILLAGDNVLRSITTWLGPPRSNLADYINTLERIKKLPGLTRILSAHGSPVENPVERVDEIIRYRHSRTEEIVNIIRAAGQKGISFHRLLETVYPGEGSMRRALVEGWVIVTIQYLEDRGRIRREDDGEKVRFVRVAG